MVEIGSKTKRKIEDYKLSRYVCYLIAQNVDPRKEVVVLAQTLINFIMQVIKDYIMVKLQIISPKELPTPNKSLKQLEKNINFRQFCLLKVEFYIIKMFLVIISL